MLENSVQLLIVRIVTCRNRNDFVFSEQPFQTPCTAIISLTRTGKVNSNFAIVKK